MFVKVDGDQAREVLSANNVSAFPTFKVFKDKAEVFTQGGFAQGAITRHRGQWGVEQRQRTRFRSRMRLPARSVTRCEFLGRTSGDPSRDACWQW